MDVAVIDFLAAMFRTPGAEDDPAAWATRFCAHQGLAAAVTLLLLAVWHPAVVVGVLLAAYALWEVAQYRAAATRSRALLADCLLDWCAWSLMVLAVAWWPVPAVLASAGILIAGVRRRSGRTA